MGRGDKRTRKGKISAGSYGNSRPHDAGSTKPAAKTATKAAPKKKTTKKA